MLGLPLIYVTILHAIVSKSKTLRWRHNGRDSVSNLHPHDCLLNRLFRHRSKKTAKLRVTGLCAGNSPGTGEFPAQMASNAENVSIWWVMASQITGNLTVFISFFRVTTKISKLRINDHFVLGITGGIPTQRNSILNFPFYAGLKLVITLAEYSLEYPAMHGISRHSALRWRHNGHDGVSNHQPHHCLLNRLFGCR